MGRHAADISASQASLVRDLAAARAGYAHDVMKDAADADQKVGELTAEVSAASRRAEETVLTSPIDGTVQQLATHTVGGVVTTAQALMTIVPDDGPVVIEATVENKDVGFVHAGQEVEVKVETFTFTRYGIMRGHVTDVSRDAATVDPRVSKHDETQDQDGGEADEDAHPPSKIGGYTVHISVESAGLNVDGRLRALDPGMSVTAEIKTGRRSVVSYLLSPLQQHISEGARER